MKLEIIKVKKTNFIEVTTNEPLPLYRRHNSDHWEHRLGDLHGWHKYTVTEFLEEAYQEFMREHTND